MLYRIDHLINEGSGWMIESIDAEYVIFSPLSRRSYIELPNKLKNSMKDLINRKKKMTINFFFGVISNI